MVRLDLTQEEAQVLAATLQSDLADLSYEIANTDSLDFRDTLKEKREILARTLEALSADTPVA